MPSDTTSGIRGECVHFVRRYYETYCGLTFKEVQNAADMVHLRSLYDANGKRYPWKTTRVVEKGCAIVWAAEGKYAPTGHVAVVIEVCKETGLVVVAEVNEQGNHRFGIRKISLAPSRLYRIARILAAPKEV
jgi:hypothetical protein